MLVSKQELPVEVAEVDGIEVDNMDFTKPSENEVLEELATNATSSYHQNTCLMSRQRNWYRVSAPHWSCTSLIRP